MLQMLCLVPRLRRRNLTLICSTHLNTNILKERVNNSTRFFNWGLGTGDWESRGKQLITVNCQLLYSKLWLLLLHQHRG